jgi:uncharacterized protein
MVGIFRLLFVLLLAVSLAMPGRTDPGAKARGLAAFSAARYAEALQEWERAADASDGEAALYIGLLHDLGRGVVQDARMALNWYERAAALGNAIAMFNIGVLYDSGTGVRRDGAMAADWYRKAASVGMPRADYALGLMYMTGDGVPRDRHQATRYFRAALAGGVTAARPRLAALGVPTPETTGKKAEDAGLSAFERAQELLLQRTPQAAQAAAALLRQAADKGDLLAAYNLAYCYDKGIGVEADGKLAYVWYGRAAKSQTASVRSAALVGMVSIATRLEPGQLAEAQAMLAKFGQQ